MSQNLPPTGFVFGLFWLIPKPTTQTLADPGAHAPAEQASSETCTASAAIGTGGAAACMPSCSTPKPWQFEKECKQHAHFFFAGRCGQALLGAHKWFKKFGKQQEATLESHVHASPAAGGSGVCKMELWEPRVGKRNPYRHGSPASSSVRLCFLSISLNSGLTVVCSYTMLDYVIICGGVTRDMLGRNINMWLHATACNNFLYSATVLCGCALQRLCSSSKAS